MTKAHLLIACLCLVPATARGEDNWPQWRGPEANGTAPKADPPITWDDNTNIKWKAALPGRGSATPIVWGDQVFVVTAIKTDRVADAADLPQSRSALREEDGGAAELLPVRRPQLRPHDRQAALASRPPPKRCRTRAIIRPTPTPPARRPPTASSCTSRSARSASTATTWTASCSGRRDLGRLNTRLGWGEAVTPVVHGDVAAR